MISYIEGFVDALCAEPSLQSATLSKGPPAGPFVSFFAECPTRHLAKLASFPSARVKTFSKPQIFVTASIYDIMTRGQVS